MPNLDHDDDVGKDEADNDDRRAKSDAHDCNVPLQDYYEPGLIRL